MTVRRCIELALGLILVVVVCLMDFANAKFLRDLVLSVGSSLIASVITDYNNSRDNEEKEVKIFLAVTKPFYVECNKLFKRICPKFDPTDRKTYPKFNEQTLSLEDANLWLDAGVTNVLNTVREIRKNQSILTAINHTWVIFQDNLKKIDEAGMMMEEIWASAESGEKEKISHFCDLYSAILDAYEEYKKIEEYVRKL